MNAMKINAPTTSDKESGSALLELPLLAARVFRMSFRRNALRATHPRCLADKFRRMTLIVQEGNGVVSERLLLNAGAHQQSNSRQSCFHEVKTSHGVVYLPCRL